MRIFVDENIPSCTVAELRLVGHDVLDIRGTPDQGMDDELLWQKAQAEERLFITTDKGFLHHRQEPHFGILIVRLRLPNQEKIHQRVMQAISQFADAERQGVTVVMRDAVQSIWRNS